MTWKVILFTFLFQALSTTLLMFNYTSLFDYMMFCTMKYKDDLMSTPINNRGVELTFNSEFNLLNPASEVLVALYST